MPAERAQQIKEKIELLAIYHGGAPDKDTAAWLNRQPANIYNTLAMGGFAEPKTPAKESGGNKRLTIVEFVDSYIERKVPDSAASTIRKFKKTRRCLREFIGERRLSDIAPADAEDFRSWLTRPRAKGGRGWGRTQPASDAHRLSNFSQMPPTEMT